MASLTKAKKLFYYYHFFAVEVQTAEYSYIYKFSTQVSWKSERIRIVWV